MSEVVNYTLLLILLAIGCAAFCLRKSPEAMMRLAAYLMSTAEADVARAEYHAKRHEAWRKELGIAESAEEQA